MDDVTRVRDRGKMARIRSGCDADIGRLSGRVAWPTVPEVSV
jgi:hypothetical protein